MESCTLCTEATIVLGWNSLSGIDLRPILLILVSVALNKDKMRVYMLGFAEQ